MIRVIWVEWKRAINWSWMISIIGVMFCICFDSWNDLLMGIENKTGAVHYFFWNSAYGGMYRRYLLPVFATLPFARSLCYERKCKVQPFIIARQGTKRYGVSKFIVNAASGGIVVALGTALFLIVLSLMFPMTSADEFDAEMTAIFHTWEAVNHPFRYGLIEVVLGFCRGMIWASAALLVSIYTADAFIVTLSPYFLSYLIVQTCKMIGISNDYRIDMILIGRVVIESSAFTIFIGCLCACILTALMGGLFVWVISKK